MKKIEERLKSARIQNPNERALLNIIHTANAMRNLANDLLKTYDLTDSQYNVLRILRGQNGKPMNLYEIGERMVHRESNVSRIVDRLEAKDLVERKVDEKNRRRVDISIKSAGLAILQVIQPGLERDVSAAFNALTAEEVEKLSDLLDKIHS